MDAREILDTMLGHLGFVVDIQEIETETGKQLQVFTAENEALIGPHGETLEDLQFLLNRLIRIGHAAHDEHLRLPAWRFQLGAQ